MDDQPARGPATAATLTSSTTGMATWAVAHYLFRGQMPPEVYAFVQLAVPALLGWAASWIAQRREDRRQGPAEGPPEAQTAQAPPESPGGPA